MPFHANAQQRLITDKPYSPKDAFTSSIVTKAPWDSIIDFATHPNFCGMTLYPRQQTLLRLIYLETDQMTQFDLDVIEEWRHGFMQRREVFGVQPDIWERVKYLKDRGYRRFPEVQAVLGRRASKGMIGGVLGAEQMGYMFSLDDWQSHYGVVPGKDGYLTVVATSQSQAKRHQFRDIAMAVEGCAYLQPHIASSRDFELSIRTPADMRRIASLKSAGMVPDHEIATLHAIAMASNSDVVRGAASFGLFLDEFAFMIQGTGSSKSGEEVYESAVPSLDQFEPDSLIYIPSSPWTKVGQFFTLYKQGSVLMKSYVDGQPQYTKETEESLGVDAEAEILDMTADPVKLVFQGPSWILYQDWERGKELVGRNFKRPIQPDLTSEAQQRRQRRNPEKFRVERMGQFAEVADQYLNPDKVEAMFAPVGWREPLTAQERGRFDRKYRIHCDPGRTGANFALAIGHVEDAPCNGCGWKTGDGGTGWANSAHICPQGGQVWPHVIMDFLHVWRPVDFPPDPESGRRTIDYIKVGSDIKDILLRFRSTEKISFDQWNSAYFLADLKQKFSPSIRVTEVTFTEKANQERYEKFKSALNLGWVSSYRDDFFDQHSSLLEQELKFLSEKNGKVIKQDFGPVTTKDLADCVQVVTVDLLHEALDRWEAGTLTAASYGSSDSAGLRAGREFERLGMAGGGTKRSGRAWQQLEEQKKDRERAKKYSPSRTSSIRTRGLR